jgi:DNA-binding Lrp family transcriptional regulator
MVIGKSLLEQEPQFLPNIFNVPAVVMLDSDLQPLDTKIYALIFWFQQLKDGRCWASNATLAKLANSSASGVANALVRLRDKKYIACIYDEETNQRKEIRTLVYFSVNPYSNEEGGVTQMSNIVRNTKKENYSSEMLENIEKVYDAWLKLMVVDLDVRRSGSIDEKRSALAAARNRTRLTDTRKAKIAARLKSMGLERVVAAVKQISTSEFHRDGIQSDGTKGTFVASLEWLCAKDERIEIWANKGGSN